jgi:hypothetical protein
MIIIPRQSPAPPRLHELSTGFPQGYPQAPLKLSTGYPQEVHKVIHRGLFLGVPRETLEGFLRGKSECISSTLKHHISTPLFHVKHDQSKHWHNNCISKDGMSIA